MLIVKTNDDNHYQLVLDSAYDIQFNEYHSKLPRYEIFLIKKKDEFEGSKKEKKKQMKDQLFSFLPFIIEETIKSKKDPAIKKIIKQKVAIYHDYYSAISNFYFDYQNKKINDIEFLYFIELLSNKYQIGYNEILEDIKKESLKNP